MEIRDGKILTDGESYEISRVIVVVLTNELNCWEGDYLVDWVRVESGAPQKVNERAEEIVTGKFRGLAFSGNENNAEPIVAQWTGVPKYRVDTWFNF